MGRRITIGVTVLAATLWGCDSAGEKTPAPTGAASQGSAPTGPSGSQAPAPSGEPATSPPADFPKQVVKASGDKNLVTLARPLLTKTVAGDGIRLILHWQDAKLGALTNRHLLGRQKIDWSKTVASLKLKIHPPGMPERTLAVKSVERQPEEAVFSSSASLVVRLDAEGVKRRKGTQAWPWESPAKDLFAKPGSYSAQVAGALALERGEVAFESAPMIVEIVAVTDSFKSLADIETIAVSHVKAQRKLSGPLRPSKETVADAAGNRVVRFGVDAESGGYHRHFIEVVVDPGGKVLSVDSRKMFTCVAAGSVVSTAAGPRLIETIQVGDVLWGYDTASQRRVLTTVQAVMSAQADRVIQLQHGLVATPSHPVFANGRWTPAASLRVGDELIQLDGSAAPLTDLRTHGQSVQVFDLTVSWPHTFFAGGLLVHNKAAEDEGSRSIYLDDWERLWHRPTMVKPTPNAPK